MSGLHIPLERANDIFLHQLSRLRAVKNIFKVLSGITATMVLENFGPTRMLLQERSDVVDFAMDDEPQVAAVLVLCDLLRGVLFQFVLLHWVC